MIPPALKTDSMQGGGYRSSFDQLIDRTDFGFPIQPAGRAVAVDEHLSQARRALESLARARQRTLRQRQFDQEMIWLAENRQKYAGQWVALDGDVLLASGKTSREVFAAVADYTPTPLVVRIENDQRPFAGW
jgi:hypothetical protein